MICPPRRSGLLPRAGSSLDRLIGGLASLKLLPYRAKSLPHSQPRFGGSLSAYAKGDRDCRCDDLNRLVPSAEPL